MTSTQIYAELLSNIRQISILAELPTPSDRSTEVSFQSGRKYLSLFHQGTTTKLELPGEVSETYFPQQPAPGLKQISWRIPLKPQPPQAHPPFAESCSAPWSASDLDNSSSLSCRACSIPIVAPGTIKTWQDLPSANWAEMMDFWHCHKPDVPKVEHDGEESSSVEKGYGANASFRAQRGVGKVDLMTFLFSMDDCAVSMPTDSNSLNSKDGTSINCLCCGCSAVLGAFDPSLHDVRLNKYALVLSKTNLQSSSLPPTLSEFLIPQLTSLTAALAVSKFLIHDPTAPEGPQTNVFMWLFAPNLTVSFAMNSPNGQTSVGKPQKAAKAFYRKVGSREAEKLIDTADASVEEVKLPEADVAALLNTLVESTKYLPSTAQKFSDWSVGILYRTDYESS